MTTYKEWVEYEHWLYEYLHAGVYGNYRNYQNLLHRLFVTPYVPYAEDDNNRVGDGVHVRFIYGNASDLYKKYVCQQIDAPPAPRNVDFYTESADRFCSVLEMMVGLAYRINDLYFDPDTDRVYMWFWLMIESLGLKKFTDDNFDGIQENNDVDNILNVFMHNTYDVHTGAGSLFPILDNYRPRMIPIWRQMEHYYKTERGKLKSLTETEFDTYYNN